jgi:cell division protease FtsH
MLGPERKSHIFSAREKRITAYHEIGHALAASVLEHADPVHKVSIVSRGHAAGYTLKLPFEDRKLQTRKEFLDDLVMSMGGYAAEKLIFGDVTTGASNDIEVATGLARAMVTKYGMSDKLGPISFETHTKMTMSGPLTDGVLSDAMSAIVDEEINKIMKEALLRAEAILVEHRSALDQMSNELVKVETLEREDFEKLLLLNGLKPKVQPQEEEWKIV